MYITQKGRLIAALSLILLTAFIGISVLNFNNARTAITHEITYSSLPLLRENLYSEIQQDFLPSLNIASMMATDSFLRNWAMEGEQDSAAVLQYLDQIRERYGYKSTFFVSARTGLYYHHDGILKTVGRDDSHDDWFYSFLDSGLDYRLDVDTDEAASNRLTIFINYRIDDFAGNPIGVTGVGIVMNDFSNFLKEKQAKYQREIYLVNHDGIVQAHSETGVVARLDITTQPGISEIAEEILTTLDTPLDSRYTGRNGDVLLTSRYIKEIDWFLIVEQSEEQALASTRRNLIRTVAIAVAASFLIILLTGFTVSHYHEQLEALATTDSLTGCANRRELNSHLERLAYRRSRYGSSVSLIMIDVDRFKQLNDKRGHQTGDQVLQELTRTIESGKRPDDLLARWGGDEFILALEADINAARILAERVRYLFSLYWSETFPKGPRVSLSMGITEMGDEDTVDALVRRADGALYQAKRNGRDRIQVSEPPRQG